ncbi:hypothetical protein SAMN05444003_0817 [Cognatiyoonia sediminum]|uniref:Uncharacterized protein n=1 Tax=Cognatiyoonia sediminum TaxID=1508389 RepID=A0A1M5MGS3_9RHOB|nr:hypothetical protein [Cognatiyoonia sediminum]SHG76332.1 hypothetical protein SAMN05444003_0817 [Cognatiyoonia sediminum]
MSLPPKVITLDVADTARAKKFVTSYKSSITRKERLSESSLLLHCLGWACFAILPWIFTAFIFWFVDERLEENAQIEELRSSQTDNKIAEIEAKILAAQEQIETGLSPALLLSVEHKFGRARNVT